MYRFQHDGRLLRSQETAVMLMESFVKLDRKDKYVWDVSESAVLNVGLGSLLIDLRSCEDHAKRPFAHLTNRMPFIL